MKAICVDDEKLLADHVTKLCRSLPGIDEATSFSSPFAALAWLESHEADLALLDIDMPGMDGMELAVRIKEKSPRTAVVFLTGYSQYAVDAFALHVSGYLLKPVDPERLKAEVEYAFSGRHSDMHGRVEARTFGNFDLLVDGKPVPFKQAKCKELLAYLVDRQGSSVTRAEAFAILWEDRLYDRPMQKQLDVIIRSLRDTLKENGVEEIFEIKGGAMRIHPEKIRCDLFRFCNGDMSAMNAYRGEYMNGYPWASMTESYMTWKAMGHRER
ncbi:MAG: response regulator [Oscillospiraceae bacterium]|nr:response regulator [Oscillospiraceae bacterium]